ncbi:MAG: hypothetical protein BWY07_01997 [Candidatus Hydrogenedentes bacterium ADurb.Bin170]|nr:MAG: hypothetical protein BWY07_01997 [Candidatus Hydrogenedentes bacterium ADurb.Bin170]
MKNNPSKDLHTEPAWSLRPPVGNQAVIAVDSPIKKENRPVLTILNPHRVAETDMQLILAAPKLASSLHALLQELAAIPEQELERILPVLHRAEQALQAAGRK